VSTYLVCLIVISVLAGVVELVTHRYRRIAREARRINVRNKPWQIGFKTAQLQEKRS
jgi:hypothetical protein